MFPVVRLLIACTSPPTRRGNAIVLTPAVNAERVGVSGALTSLGLATRLLARTVRCLGDSCADFRSSELERSAPESLS